MKKLVKNALKAVKNSWSEVGEMMYRSETRGMNFYW